MFNIHGPLDDLLKAAPDRWRRTKTRSGHACWTHPNGLQMIVQRRLAPPYAWDLRFVYGIMKMQVQLPRTRHDTSGHEITPHTLGTDLTPLLRDITAWGKTLDIHPMARVIHQIEAWMVLHGCTGRYNILMQRNAPQGIKITSIHLFRDEEDVFWVPRLLIEALQPDIQEVWMRTPSPPQEADTRSWDIHLTAVSAHARMAQVAAAIPEVTLVDPPHIEAQA